MGPSSPLQVHEQDRSVVSRLLRHWAGTGIIFTTTVLAVGSCSDSMPQNPSCSWAGAKQVGAYALPLLGAGALACAVVNGTALYVTTALLNNDMDAENVGTRKAWALAGGALACSLLPASGRVWWRQILSALQSAPVTVTAVTAIGGAVTLWRILGRIPLSSVMFTIGGYRWRTLANTVAHPTSVRGLCHIMSQIGKQPMSKSRHNLANAKTKNADNLIVLYNPTLYAPMARLHRATNFGHFETLARLPEEDLIINGTFVIEPVESFSACCKAPHLHGLYQVLKDGKGPLVHVTDPGTGRISWYTLASYDFGVLDHEAYYGMARNGILPDVTEEEGGTLLPCLLEALPGMRMSELRSLGHELTIEDKLRLCLAEILVPVGYLEAREAEFQASLSEAKAAYDVDGVCLFDNLVPPLQLDALRTYMHRVRQHTPERLDETSSRYLYMWADLVTMMFNSYFLELAEKVVEERLVSTKCISLYYPPGSILDVHVDSLPYPFSMSISLEWNAPEGISGPLAVLAEEDAECNGRAVVEARKRDTTDVQKDLQRTAHGVPCLSLVSDSLLTPLQDLPFRYGQAVLFAGHRLPHFRSPSPIDAISISFSWDFAHLHE